MATWIGADQNDFHGAAAVASGWFERARRLLDPLPPGADHGWLAFHEGYIAHANGDRVRAIELAATAAGIGRRFDVPDLEMLGLALQGAAQVASAEVEERLCPSHPNRRPCRQNQRSYTVHASFHLFSAD